MSISPPSLWIMVGRPACTSARIATALFSHKVRSHSSRTLCARVSVCGGALRAAVAQKEQSQPLHGLKLVIKKEVLPTNDQLEFPSLELFGCQRPFGI